MCAHAQYIITAACRRDAHAGGRRAPLGLRFRPRRLSPSRSPRARPGGGCRPARRRRPAARRRRPRVPTTHVGYPRPPPPPPAGAGPPLVFGGAQHAGVGGLLRGASPLAAPVEVGGPRGSLEGAERREVEGGCLLLSSPAPGMAGTRVGIAGALAEACASATRATWPMSLSNLTSCSQSHARTSLVTHVTSGIAVCRIMGTPWVTGMCIPRRGNVGSFTARFVINSSEV